MSNTEPFEEPELQSPSSDGIESSMPLAKTKSLENRVSLPREILVVGLISLAQFTTQIGIGGTLAITHIIGDHFQVTDSGVLSWLTAGYSLTVGTFILVSGRLGDLFGWKKMLVIGYLWFALWSIALGLSWYSNHVLFVFCRVLQGLGPSITMPNGLALLGALYAPGKRKAMSFAVFGGCAPGGAVTGYVFASLFALTWWPWAFWSFGIALVSIGVAAAFVIPDPQDEKPGLSGRSFMEALRELDGIAAAVGVLGLILFNFAWNQAPIVGWASPYIIVTLILGVLLIPGFFYLEIKVAPNPLLPLQIFTLDNAFMITCVSLGWLNFGIWIFYLVQILEIIRGTPPILVSAYLSPLAIAGFIAAIATGILLSKIKPAWVMLIAMCAFFTGTTLVATLPPNQIYWAQIFVTTIIAPFGMDMSFPSSTLVISNSVEKKYQGVAASLINTVVNYSISLGLGFAGTVETNTNNGGTTMADVLKGYRSALYLGMGLSGFGILVALAFVAKSYVEDRRKNQATEKTDAESQAR